MAYIGNDPSFVRQGRRAVYTFTATLGQRDFTGVDDNGLTLDLLQPAENDVYFNGVRLIESDDYNISGDTLTLVSGAAAGDQLVVVTQDEIQNIGSYTKAEADSRYINYDGDIVNGDIQVVGDIEVQDLTASGTVTSAKLAIGTNNAPTDSDISLSGNAVIGGDISLNITTGSNGFVVRTGASDASAGYSDGVTAFRVQDGGDVSFFDTSANAKLFWDASTESLGIGTTSPGVPLVVQSNNDQGTRRTILDLKTSESTTGTGANLDFSQGNTVVNQVSSVYQNGGEFALAFSTYDNNVLSERVSISAAGHLAIKTTNNQGLYIGDTPSNYSPFGSGVPTIHLQGTATNGRAGAIYFAENDGSQTGSIYSTDGNDGYGGIVLNSAQGPIKLSTGALQNYRLVIETDGKIKFSTLGAVGSGIGAADYGYYFDRDPTKQIWSDTNEATNNGKTHALCIRTPVLDSTNVAALVISENGAQASGRNGIWFQNEDLDGGTGYIKARMYTEVGGSYNATNFFIDVADSSRNIQNRLKIDQNGTFYGSSSNNISDQRLKENIETIPDPVEKIKGLTGRTFTWKEESTKADGKTKYGFIAQEVDSVVPDLVEKETGLIYFDDDDNIVEQHESTNVAQSVNEIGIIPILVEAIKELTARIEELENR